MSSERLNTSRPYDLDRLRRLGIWLPVTVVGLLFLVEGIIEGLYAEYQHYDIYVIHPLMIALIGAGAYFFFNSIFSIIQRKEKQILRHSQELAALEQHFRALIESSSDGIALFDARGALRYATPSTTRILGYVTKDLADRNLLDLIHPDERAEVRTRVARLAQTPESFTSGSIRLRHKDGSWRWIEAATRNLLADPSIQAFICNFRDITERRQAEEALRRAHDQLESRVQERTKELARANEALRAEIAVRTDAEEELRRSRESLRALAARLESTREDERTRIAREIHDELGQLLTSLKIDVLRLAARLPQDKADLTKHTNAMLGLIDATLDLVRRIAMELRPGVLDDLGLVSAIDWQAQEFQSRTAITCQFTSGLEDVDLDREKATAMFRILQEALTNVARHSNATGVTIRLKEEADTLSLVVADNGRGITATEGSDAKSLGLVGMRERAHLLGGQVAILGVPGQGTTVTVSMPFTKPASESPGTSSQES